SRCGRGAAGARGRGGGRARRGARARGARDRGAVARRELRHPPLRARPPPARPRRAVHRRGDGGGDVEHRRGAQLAGDVHGDRLLPPVGAPGGVGRALPHRVQGGDRGVGPLRLPDRDLRGDARVAHRGREPVRVVLLRLDPRRLPAGDDRPRARGRRVRRAARRDVGGGGRGLRGARGLVPLAQRRGRGDGGGGGRAGQRAHRGAPAGGL
ncbi:MAG: Sodium/solute symporter, partial [uncultured Gemmatimonadaceae bacterium]